MIEADSRVVDLTISYNPIFVTISAFKPLFFNGLKNEQASWATWKPKTPESNKSEIGDGGCEPLRKNRTKLKSQYPPAFPGLVWQNVDRIIGSLRLVIELCNPRCKLMQQSSISDWPWRHHLALNTISA